MKTPVTEAIRRLVHHPMAGFEPPAELAADVELVRAWLSGSATAGVAMTGADLEGILECIEWSTRDLDAIDGLARDGGNAATRSTWRIKAERIRRAAYWADPLLGRKAAAVPAPAASSIKPAATYPPGDVDIFWTDAH